MNEGTRFHLALQILLEAPDVGLLGGGCKPVQAAKPADLENGAFDHWFQRSFFPGKHIPNNPTNQQPKLGNTSKDQPSYKSLKCFSQLQRPVLYALHA